MADPTSNLPFPYLDQTQVPGWIDAQRKQQMAQMLMGAFQQSNQTPENWNSMKVVPRKGALGTVATLAQALMAGKAQGASMDASNAYLTNRYAPQQPQGQQPGDDKTFNGPTGNINVPGQQPSAPSGNVQSPQQNPMIPAGMPRQTAQFLMDTAPGEYGKTLAAQYQPLDIDRQLRAANIDPNSQIGVQYKQNLLAKSGRDYETVRGDNTVFDKATGKAIYTAPAGGIQTTYDAQGNPSQSTIPGASTAATEASAAKNKGIVQTTPIKVGVDENGEDVLKYPDGRYGNKDGPQGAPRTATSSLGVTSSPAAVKAQQSGAEASQAYATRLAEGAKGATDLRRGLSELRNLSQQAGPSANNQNKLKLGAVLVAGGADPDKLSKFLGVDISALEAAAHTEGGVAVSGIKQMNSSRGTNFDLETFLKQNPNLNMASPGAFNRVLNYMDDQAKDTISMQRDFATGDWRKGVAPQDLENAHTAHWLDLQNQKIDAGQTNSRIPNPAQQHSLEELQAEARKRGLIK